MAIDFNPKDIIHRIAAKFVPAHLPEAKKPFYLKSVNQPELDIHELASKAEIYNISTPPKVIEEGFNAAAMLARYLAADGYIFRNSLFTLKVVFSGEYDGTETKLHDEVHPSPRFLPSGEFRNYIKTNVKVVIDGKFDSDGFIAEVSDDATGAIDEAVTIGRLSTIRGVGIKVDCDAENAETAGVYYCPKDGDGEKIKVMDIAVNEPRTLKVVVPPGLKKGAAYTIEIVTQSSPKSYGTVLKNTRVIKSDFTVIARK